jgi:hypothetical protein
MVYFFLVFDSESSANSFAKNYYDENTDEGKNLSTLNNAISTSHYNASILTPSNITSQSLDKFTFYYNGCILVPDSAASSDVKVYTGKLSSLSSSDETSLRKQERTYQETFAALRHKLITDYDKLTGTNEKTNDVYENLVGDSVRNTYVSEPEKKITVGEKKVFVTDVTNTAIDQMCAVVVNGDYTIDRKSTDPGNEAYEYGDPTMGSGDRFPVHVVIAEGDVTVKCNFNGLIIAKGKVTIAAKNLTISADADLSQQALRIQNADGVSASDYLLDGGAYLLNSTSSSSTGDVSISDYIAYNNWVKQ